MPCSGWDETPAYWILAVEDGAETHYRRVWWNQWEEAGEVTREVFWMELESGAVRGCTAKTREPTVSSHGETSASQSSKQRLSVDELAREYLKSAADLSVPRGVAVRQFARWADSQISVETSAPRINARGLIEKLHGYVTGFSDRRGYSETLQQIECALGGDGVAVNVCPIHGPHTGQPDCVFCSPVKTSAGGAS